MSRKRVYEIAKAEGVTSKELIAALTAAGTEVKAAASSVEEAVALEALAKAGSSGESGPKGQSTKEGAAKPAPKATEGSKSKSSRPVKPGAGPAPPADGQAGASAGGKKRRRVVIDSNASRRDQGGPPPPQRPPRRRGGRRRKPVLEEPSPVEKEPEAPQATRINSGVTVRELAELLDLSSADLIKKLMTMGEMATLTQTLTDESVQAIADEYERKIEIVSAAEEEPEVPEFEDSADSLEDRPPVVTIMGHVDHGKTSLLDAIRQTEVAAGEAGGITQHIGAYQVHHNGDTITFLDTPGHEAFTAMRARGAQVTDVAVIVVAADDGVMPQTREAIDHARAAEVPMLIAVNKVDLEGAQPDRIRNDLASEGLNPEDWGGDTVYCDVSAKTGQGLDNLLDMILLVTELEELSANPDAPASGTVVESQLDPGRGPVVTGLVQRGTLEVGDSVVAGPVWGKVRAMHDYTGADVSEAVPGMPVEVLGFDGVCEAGEFVQAVANDREARQVAGEKQNRLKAEAIARRQARKVTLDEIFAKAQAGELKELNVVLKSDVAGSLEALQDEIAKVPQEQVAINVIHAQTGGINESDVMLAAASGAVIIGFNVRPLSDARKAAQAEGVDVRTYSVIYKVTEDLRAAMEGMLDTVEVEEALGEAEVKEVFKASKVGRIAGCQVTEGAVTREAEARLVREGTVIWTGRLGSLRRFKDAVDRVEEGQECGIVLEDYQDVKVGDVLEFFSTREVEQTLA
ncbi:MAG: translation initiation factor IF-2 [Solirubrobacterales bacterium]|nr:translation initiation factor IF-2 [Solirubrobacterales bacterium]